MKVSFDFDGTLTRHDVQQYAMDLINLGFEVYICTSRFSPDNAPSKEFNDDLFKISDEIGIKRDNIIFTNYADKSEFLKDNGFIFHLDDDNIELLFIKNDTDVIPIYLFNNKHWKIDCEEVIKNGNFAIHVIDRF